MMMGGANVENPEALPYSFTNTSVISTIYILW